MSSQKRRRRPPPPVRNPGRNPQASSRWWLIGGIAVVLVVAVAIAVAASGGSGDSGSGSSSSSAKHETGKVTVDGTPLPPYAGPDVTDKAVGDLAPTLHGEGFDGGPVSIGPTGSPQVVMFVAHWCPHCQAEVPRVVELAKKGAFDGIDVATVATGTRSDLPNYPPSAWLAREDWPFHVMVDSATSTAATAYGLQSYPYFVFLDGDGTVLGRAAGEIAPSTLSDILAAMRAGKAVAIRERVELERRLTDATERFVALVQGPSERVRLDEAALLIAMHAHPELDVLARLGQLDALAPRVETRDAAGVAGALFGVGGFTGNTVDYYEPENSYLDDVLDRGLGIPITLSVLMIEVGRRCGVELVGVGAPGHFLVGVPSGDPVGPHDAGVAALAAWYDPFHGAEPLDAAGCAALFARMRGEPARRSGTEPARPLDPAHLAPVGHLAILDRMLANLQMTLLRRSPAAAAWPTRLRLAFPSVPPLVRAELAATLGNLGQFGEAAAHLDAVALQLDADAAARMARAAAQLRARAN